MADKPRRKEAKKSFFEVSAPMISTRIALYSPSAEALVGRIVKIDLTRSLRGKGLEMRLRVSLDSKGKLVGEPISVELVGSYIRRMVRKGTDYVEDSFGSKCKDFEVIVKPFLITRHKVSRTVRHALRLAAKQYIEGYLTTRTAKEVFSEIISGKVQKDMSAKLRKIYPLALCEIRAFKIIEKK